MSENLLLQISYDIVENIKVEGDHIRDTLQELQDAVHLTKVIHDTHSLPLYLKERQNCDFVSLHLHGFLVLT